MSRYQFLSPGAAAGDALVDQLAKSRAEQRQNLLDEITRKNAESERTYRDQSAQADQRRAAADEEWRKSQLQGVSDAKAAKQRRHDMIDQMLGDQNQMDPQVRQALSIANAGEDDSALDAVINHMLTSRQQPTTRTGGSIWTTDEKGNPYNTGEWMEGVQGDQFHPRPVQPRDPASLVTPQLFQMPNPDPEHKGEFLSYWLKPGEQPSEKNRVQAGTVFKGPTPPHDAAPPRDPNAPSSAEFIQLAKMRDKSEKEKGAWFGGNSAQAAYDQMLNSIVARMPGVTRDLMNHVVDALSDESASKASSQDIVNHQLQNGMDQKDAAVFAKLLMIARGK
jgi:hypothetical protein